FCFSASVPLHPLPSSPPRRSSDLLVGLLRGRRRHLLGVFVEASHLGRPRGVVPLRLPRARRAGLQRERHLLAPRQGGHVRRVDLDRKSIRLNSSHRTISYAVFCLK